MKYYAVKIGRKPGIYETWEDCKAQVHGFPQATYKKFALREEAEAYVRGEKVERRDEATTINHDPALPMAYVDGSYDRDTHRYSCGVLLLYGEKSWEISKAFDDEDWTDMRNVAGEIRGAMEAINFAIEQGWDNLLIVHDYEGVAKWPTGQWRAKKDCTQAYVDFVKSHDKLSVQFQKVRAHSGNEYNDRADRLAKDALGLS